MDQLENLPGLSPVMIVLVLIIREFLGLVKVFVDRVTSKPPPENGETLIKQQRGQAALVTADMIKHDSVKKLDELYNWHNQRDSEGVFLWYNKRETREAIIKLARSVERVANALTEVNNKVNALAKIAEDNQRKLELLERDIIRRDR